MKLHNNTYSCELCSMTDRTCKRCGHEFRDPSTLRRHLANKKPCNLIVDDEDLPRVDREKQHRCRYCGRAFTSLASMQRHTRTVCKIANSEEGMEKLLQHTLQRQLQEQSEQIAELSGLVKQLAIQAKPEAASVTINGNATIVEQQIVTNIIVPWDSDRRFDISAAQMAAAFAENTLLREYAQMPDHQLTDPDLSPPYITEMFVDFVKRGHTDPTSRNIYINPRHADQVLVHLQTGKWGVIPLTQSLRMLLDAVAQRIHRAILTESERTLLPLEAQNAMAIAELGYTYEPDEYAERAKSSLTAHLVNTAPDSAVSGLDTVAPSTAQ